jgi:hypothetical protein
MGAFAARFFAATPVEFTEKHPIVNRPNYPEPNTCLYASARLKA